MKIYSTVLFLFCTILCASAQVEDTLGRRVGIEASVHKPTTSEVSDWAVDNTKQPGEYVDTAYILIYDGYSDHNSNDNLIDAMGWDAGTHGKMFPLLQPGKLYTLSAESRSHASNADKRKYFDALFDVPDGYDLYVGGTPVTSFRFTLYDIDDDETTGRTKYPIQLVKRGDKPLTLAADFKNVMSDKYLFAMGIGQTRTGASAGSIWVKKDFFMQSTAVINPTILSASSIYEETIVNTGYSPYIVNTDGHIDVVSTTTPTQSITLKYYDKSTPTINFATIKIEKTTESTMPDGAIIFNQMLITRTYGTNGASSGTNIYKVKYEYAQWSNGDYQWVIKEGQTSGNQWLKVKTYKSIFESGKRKETVTIKSEVGDTSVLQTVLNTYGTIDYSHYQIGASDFTMPRAALAPPSIGQWPMTQINNNYGPMEVLEKVQIDPDDKNYTTTLVYYDDYNMLGSFGKIKSIQYPTTSWVYYEYNDSRYDATSESDLYIRGCLKRLIKPWSDSATLNNIYNETNLNYTDLVVSEYNYTRKWNIYDYYYDYDYQLIIPLLSTNYYGSFLGDVKEFTNNKQTKEITTAYYANTYDNLHYEYSTQSSISDSICPPTETIITRISNADGDEQESSVRQFTNEATLGLANRVILNYDSNNGKTTVHRYSVNHGTNTAPNGMYEYYVDSERYSVGAYEDPLDEGNFGLYVPDEDPNSWFSFESVGNLLDDSKNTQTAITYDHTGKITNATDYVFWLSPVVSSDKSYLYDSRDNLKFTSNNGSYTEYNRVDDRIASVEKGYVVISNNNKVPQSIETINTYDALGRVTEKTSEGIAGTGEGAQADIKTDYTYDALNNILTETITAGALSLSTSKTYTKFGKLSSETDSNGYTTKYRYESNGEPTKNTVIFPGPQPSTETEALTSVHKYYTETYSKNGSLKSVTGTAKINTFFSYAIDADGFTTTTTHYGTETSARWGKIKTDWAGRKVLEESPAMPGSSDTRKVTYEYDPDTGYVSRIRHPEVNNQSNYVDEIYVYEYGDLIRSGMDVTSTSAATPGAQLVDASMDRITEKEWHYASDSGNVYLVNTVTMFTQVDDAFKKTVAEEWTQLNLDTAYPNRRSFKKVIDANGKVTSTYTEFEPSSPKKLITTTEYPDVTNHGVIYTYNGRPYRSVSTDGATTKIEYDDLGRITCAEDARGLRTTTSYKTGKNQIDTVTRPGGFAEQYFYYIQSEKGAGQVYAKQTDGTKIKRMAYDNLGHMIASWGSGSNTYPIYYKYDTTYGDLRFQYTYLSDTIWQDVGSVCATMPNESLLTSNSVTEWQYDAATGVLLNQTFADAGLGYKSNAYTYWPNGSIKDITDTRGWVKSLGYDVRTNELTSIDYHGHAYNVAYTYNRLGKVATINDITGIRTMDYKTQDGGELSHITYNQDYNFYRQPDLTMNYESGTARSSGYTLRNGSTAIYAMAITQADGTTSGYDTSNRITDMMLDAKLSGVSAQHYKIAFDPANKPLVDYTELDLGTAAGTGAKLKQDFTYTSDRSLLSSIASTHTGNSTNIATYSYEYDSFYRRKTIQTQGKVVERYLTEAGCPYNSLITKVGYDTRDEVTSHITYRGTNFSSYPDELPGRNFSYNYDSIGNRLNSSQPVTGADGSTSYTPNALNQYNSRTVPGNVSVSGFLDRASDLWVDSELKQAANSSDRKGDYFYTNKTVDNSTKGSGGYISTYGRKQKPPGTNDPVAKVQRNYYVPQTPEAYVYDEAGNLTSDGEWGYSWDAENRLIGMWKNTKATKTPVREMYIGYSYDSEGRRVAKAVYDNKINGVWQKQEVTLYAWVGDRVVMEMDGSGNIKKKYFWKPTATQAGSLLMVADTSSNKLYYPFYDGNGSLTGTVNQTDGTLASVYEYGPFGEPIRESGEAASVCPFRFGTEYSDRETGLVAYRYRYYNPVQGRFISRDPLGEKGGLNLYAFCNNDPVNHRDHLGLSGWGELNWDTNYDIGFWSSVWAGNVRAKYEEDKARKRNDVTINPAVDEIVPTPPKIKSDDIKPDDDDNDLSRQDVTPSKPGDVTLNPLADVFISGTTNLTMDNISNGGGGMLSFSDLAPTLHFSNNQEFAVINPTSSETKIDPVQLPHGQEEWSSCVAGVICIINKIVNGKDVEENSIRLKLAMNTDLLRNFNRTGIDMKAEAPAILSVLKELGIAAEVGTVYDESDIAAILATGNPAIFAINNGSNSLHAIVVQATSFTGGLGSTNYTKYDPWPANGKPAVGNPGQIGQISLSDLNLSAYFKVIVIKPEN